MVKHQRKRKLRGGFVGALIGLALSVAAPYAIEGLMNMGGPSVAEQEAAIREDYYARLAEWDREQLEKKLAEQERQRIEQQKKNMIANARASQASRAEEAKILDQYQKRAQAQQQRAKAAARPQEIQLSRSTAPIQQQQKQLQNQIQIQTQQNALRLAEMQQRQATQQQQLTNQSQINQQRMAARQQVMQRGLQQQMQKLETAATIQEQAAPSRRFAQTDRTNPFAMVGSGSKSESIALLRKLYGRSKKEALAVLAAL